MYHCKNIKENEENTIQIFQIYSKEEIYNKEDTDTLEEEFLDIQ